MATSLDTILSYKSVDLSAFEIRGAKSGINNARTTGPVYVDGSYFPATSAVSGDGSFSSDSSRVINFTSGYITADNLYPGDFLNVNSQAFLVQRVISPSEFELKDPAGFEGTFPIDFTLTERSYVVEPDTAADTSSGIATFTKGSKVVTGIGTQWMSTLTPGDFIRPGNYLQYYRIDSVPSDALLNIATPHAGNTTLASDYTSKRWQIGRTEIRYSKDNIAYDNMSAKWTYDSFSGTDLTTSTSFAGLADGIDLRLTHSLNTSAPDIMDVNTVVNKVFSKSTQYDTFQYALPVVPHPATLDLVINGKHKDQFPQGNQDYVLTFTQSPIYTPPPPPALRKVANIMPLKGTGFINPSISATQFGQIQAEDASGSAITGIMPGSEIIVVGDTTQIAYRDYLLEPFSGLLEMTQAVIDEPIVKYVVVNYNPFVDYGLEIYLNGIRQKVTIPFSSTDDVIFQPDFGRLKPAGQDHPGPNDTYEVHYMTDANIVSDTIQGSVGQTLLRTTLYPIKQYTLFVSQDGGYLTEGEDYVVGYLSGKITLLNPLVGVSTFLITYTVLSKQINDITYINGVSYCTSHDSRLIITDPANFGFQLSNTTLDFNTVKIEILRVYNETLDLDYDITGFTSAGNTFNLAHSALNENTGLSASDIVLVDYKFPSDTVEYAPVSINYVNILSGSDTLYFEGIDLTNTVSVGSIMNVGVANASTQYYYVIQSITYDGLGTIIVLNTTASEDLTNPNISITDSPVTFLPAPISAGEIISGTMSIPFLGKNVADIFRPGTLLNVENNIYAALNASYDGSNTQVALTSRALQDCTSAFALSTISYSDIPVYNEGAVEITPSKAIVTIMSQPALLMDVLGTEVYNVVADSSALSIDSTSFHYDGSNIAGLISTINSANIPSLSVTSYAPLWQANKIKPSTTEVYSGSSTVLYANNALRDSTNSLAFVDSTNFTVGDSGKVTLLKPLKAGERYKMDYIGRTFLDSTQVNYSFRYFTSLPAKSNVVASFEYDNLDQFYVQVLDQRDFFQSITIPRMTQEAYQLNGNVGQGGEVTGDDNTEPQDGGISGDEYRRQDTAIECDIFKNVYDFFQDRLVNYGFEMQAATGLRLFNNDGTFSEDQQTAANLSINRIFPSPNYTKFEPMQVNPLTGYYTGTGAFFANGRTDVTSLGSQQWTSKLRAGDFIRRGDSTFTYRIASVPNDSSISLATPFLGISFSNPYKNYYYGKRVPYMASSIFPIYDDDGYVGPKVVGEVDSDFGLESGDLFFCTMVRNDGNVWPGSGNDTTNCFYQFQDAPFPFSLFTPSVSELSAASAAQLLTSNIHGLIAKVENVIDSAQPYGYRTAIVLRTDSNAEVNTLILHSSPNDAGTKLGFTTDTTYIGNWDRTAFSPEITSAAQELGYIYDETSVLDDMFAAPDKLSRALTPLYLDFTSAINGEIAALTLELSALTSQIDAQAAIMLEPGIPGSFADTSASYTNAVVALADASVRLDRAQFILSELNFWPITANTNTGYVSNITGKTSFVFADLPAYDLRIQNAPAVSVVPGLFGTPTVNFLTGPTTVNGTWYGWDPSVSNEYSLKNDATFVINTTPLFYIKRNSPAVGLQYSIDTSAIRIDWTTGVFSHTSTLTYSSHLLVGDMTTAINSLSPSSFTAIGGAPYASLGSEGFINTNGAIAIAATDATIYQGLRNVVVNYGTISDKNITDRFSYITDRSSFIDNREAQLISREEQIKSDILQEGLLRTSTGDPGDIYLWANNRFNRRQGCYAKLKQIEQMIATNQSAASINKMMVM